MTPVPHVSMYIGESQIWVFRSEAPGRPAAEFCSSAGVSVENEGVVCSADDAAELFPFRYVDDPTLLVGSKLVPAQVVYDCIMGAALGGVGVSRDAVANVVEVVFPTHWGTSRRSVVRDALRPLCREVLFVADAVAAAIALGERAPGKSVVVVLSGLTANVTQVDRSAAVARLGPCVRFPDIGTRDALSDPSRVGRLMDRAHDIGSGLSADLIVLTTTIVSRTPEPAHSAVSSHSISGRDIVRGLATGMAASSVVEPSTEEVRASAPGVPGVPGVPGEPVVLGRNDGPSRYRMPVRSAQWLNASVTVTPNRHDRWHRGVVASSWVAASLVAASLVAAGVTIGGAIWLMSPRPSSVAEQPITRDASATTSAAETSAATTSAAAPSVAVTTESARASATVMFERDRVSIRLPPGWGMVENPVRMELEPQDGEAMKIIVMTTPLSPGVSPGVSEGAQLDYAVDAIEQQLAARDGDGVFADFRRSVEVGDRTGASYTETPADGSVVRWNVFVDQGLQVSVGCQFAPDFAGAIDEPCAAAVGSLAVATA